jgi:hypothetical protein|eukprot:CAMPEP_0202491284 /NCGR_PEP_ID=MMETSP1361-20130828/8390_1 /ASSEMBLY_ACC=CAM_ASM_000849 /TAXON_ID=210615 /ORGANISM="Staurosira complex sp., Strain CCMP2646" /LENGTH=295 /DNA_ID=CAMNT_0049121303 /DNA_START=131 /DNA_END=1018 /DNA_ORIENTATION=-
MMHSDPVSPGQMGQDAAASEENVSKSVKEPEVTKEFESLFRTILASCGGLVETAALFLGPSDCVSCFNESRSPRSPRSTRRNPKLKQAQKLKENPSREGEVVDVPIKLVKSRSGKAVTNDEGEVYDPYRSFDDNISAISAHTLDEMASKQVGPIISSHRSGRKGNHRPRNGDELLPPSPARLSSSESSDDSAARDNPHDEIENDVPFRRTFQEPLQISKVEPNSPTYELIDNDIAFVKKRPKRRSHAGKKGTGSTPKVSERPADAHLAPTPKARSRKASKRRMSRQEFQPQVAEI